MNKELIKTFFGLAIIAVASGYLTSIYIVSEEQNIFLEKNLKETIQTSSRQISQAKKETKDFAQKLSSEVATSKSLEGQVGNLNNAVDVLQKYAKTDKQLLEKYSKVYFLNENYVPEALVSIDSAYLFDNKKTAQFHAKAYAFLEKILLASKSDGLNLSIASAYRSFGEQTSLKSNYKYTFGTTAANKFSADQGYSEHQLGTTVDFTAASVGAKLDGFEKTKEYQWLKDNAYKYGFILSYPTSNKYYVFEPWHWRFVGLRLAAQLHDESKNFYDMDQRVINEYLVQIFDQI